jgi:hypothetical protein
VREVGIIIRFICTSPPHKGKGWDEGHGVRGRIVFEKGGGKYYSNIGWVYITMVQWAFVEICVMGCAMPSVIYIVRLVLC